MDAFFTLSLCASRTASDFITSILTSSSFANAIHSSSVIFQNSSPSAQKYSSPIQTASSGFSTIYGDQLLNIQQSGTISDNVFLSVLFTSSSFFTRSPTVTKSLYGSPAATFLISSGTSFIPSTRSFTGIDEINTSPDISFSPSGVSHITETILPSFLFIFFTLCSNKILPPFSFIFSPVSSQS